MALSTEKDKELSDLMRLTQQGDKRAYDTLLREIVTLSKSYFQKRLGTVQVAEDLVQELLLSIHSSRHTFDCNRPFAPWLFAIARKRIADYWRSEWQRINREVSEYDGVNEIPKSSAASSNGMTDYVSIAMEELPERQKNVITLLKVNGYSLKEAADKLKMTEGAVKVTAHRAYNALRKKLEIKIYEHE